MQAGYEVSFSCAQIFRSKMKEIEIGKIVSAVGIKGEVKIYSYSDNPMKLAEHEKLYAGNTFRILEIENVRTPKGNTAVVKFREIRSRNDAEKLKGDSVFIYEDELKKLGADEYYVRDLIGMKTVDIEDGACVGTLIDVIQNTAQDIYLIKTDEGKEIMIPAVKEFIKEINVGESSIYIKFIEGMR